MWERREACLVSSRGPQPLEMVWLSQPPSLSSFPFFLSVPLCLSFLLSLPVSLPNLPVLTHSYFKAGEWVQNAFSLLYSAPGPSQLSCAGDRVAGVSTGLGAHSQSLSYLHTPFPLETDPQTLSSLPHSTSCCKLAINLGPIERH